MVSHGCALVPGLPFEPDGETEYVAARAEPADARQSDNNKVAMSCFTPKDNFRVCAESSNVNIFSFKLSASCLLSNSHLDQISNRHAALLLAMNPPSCLGSHGVFHPIFRHQPVKILDTST